MSKDYKKPATEDIKKMLTPQQYKVTQEEGTERAFQNEYWDNKRPGIYVDVVSGEPLFSSLDKFDSGTGWPSFTKPIEAESVTTKKDRNLLFQERTEVKSKIGGSHLGHVFDDGPKPTGQRWCMNSAALRFIPAEDLEKQGYGQYASLFKGDNLKKNGTELATFAAGCFWGVEHILKGLKGVKGTTVGYVGGQTDRPDYKIVSTGTSGHAEAVQVEFDPKIISYKELLDYFWRLHDPTQVNRQGVDVGTQYRSAIFFHSEDQQRIAEQSKAEFDKSGVFKQKAATQIVPASKFFSAEEYHQDYFERNGGHVCHTLRAK